MFRQAGFAWYKVQDAHHMITEVLCTAAIQLCHVVVYLVSYIGVQLSRS